MNSARPLGTQASLSDDEARHRVTSRLADDGATQALGITVGVVACGRVELFLPTTPSMVNGQGVLHGGYAFLLGDTCFAYTCESFGIPSLTRQAEILYIAPGHPGRLKAQGEVRTRYGRNTVIDVAIYDEDEQHIAEFRGYGVQIISKG